MKQLVIMPGGFHPFHAGHAALYQSAVEAFPGADVYVAATNDTSTRPFPFPVKEKLAQLAGVAPNRFVQVKSPFRAEEIVHKFDPSNTQLIFVRSEKDAGSPPRPGGVKKDGTPSYLQPYNDASDRPLSQSAYMAYLPTVEFGPGMTSATEIRSAWPKLNEKRKTALVMSLYPKTQTNPKLAATVVKLLDTALGVVDESALDNLPRPNKRNQFKSLHKQRKQRGLDEQGVAETINSAILNPRFKHKQKIGDYTYTATSEDFEGAPLLWIKAYDGNKEIGHILFEIIVRSPGGRRMPSADYLESGGTEVDPAYRNKGVASTMYAYAKMLGNDIRASYNQTSQGKAMWAAWEKAGDAKHLIGTAAESAVGENQGWAATLEESTGQVLDLTKNFSNHQRVHAEVVDVLPSGKVKLRVVVADAVPGKKPTVAVGQALSMAVNYLRRAPRVTEAENIKVEPVAKSLRIQNTQTQPKQNVYVAPDKKKTPAVVNHIKTKDQPTNEDYIDEKWSDKYKQSINCDRPQGFSQRAHCAGRKK